MVDALDSKVSEEAILEYVHLGADVEEEDNIAHAALAPTNVLA